MNLLKFSFASIIKLTFSKASTRYHRL